MDTLAKAVSLAAAGCLICASCFLYGELSGLGHVDLVWYLTFADFVNFAPAMLVAQGIALGIFALQKLYFFDALATTDPRAQQHNRIFGIIFLVVLFGLITVATFFGLLPYEWELTFIPLLLLSTIMTSRLRPIFLASYGENGALLFDNFLHIAFIAIVSGFLYSLVQTNGDRHLVCTDHQAVIVGAVLPLDRGLVTVDSKTYILYPWSTVKAVQKFDKDTASKLGPASKLCASL